MTQEMMGFWDGSGITWTICKQCTPHSGQITTHTPHHSIFTGRIFFLTPNQQCQSTEGTKTSILLQITISLCVTSNSSGVVRVTVLLVGLPAPWPDFVSTRINNGLFWTCNRKVYTTASVMWYDTIGNAIINQLNLCMEPIFKKLEKRKTKK